jgi:hypothetical protein
MAERDSVFMRRGSNKTLAAFRVLLALTVALGLNIEAARDPLLARASANQNQTSRLAFSLSARGTAAVLTTGTFAPTTAPGIAMADFTGDTHPDLATVEVDQLDSLVVGYWIEIRLTEGSQQFLQLTAPFGGLLITPKDLTGDGNLDLVVRSAESRAVVAVFLNDGAGHFSRADTKTFANAIPDGYLQSAFLAQEASRGATVAYVESHGAGCLRESFRYLRERQSRFLSSNQPVASQLFLSFGANRAPPSFA